MSRRTLPDDWWPDWFHDLAAEDPLASDRVVVAQIEATPAGHLHYRHLFTAFVPLDRLTQVLEHPGGIGHRVSATGPHPSDYRGEWSYIPRFWIDAVASLPAGLEPLVVSWESANQLVLWPDQGFLMTYGLIPRLVPSDGGPTIHWDDPAAPRADVVVARLVSSYGFPAHTDAVVTVARDFLEDYATIRGQALIQVYYAKRAGPLTGKVLAAMHGKKVAEFTLKGRLLDMRLRTGDPALAILAQVWEVRPLLQPGTAPISAGRWEYGSLTWPGIAEPIPDEAASRRLLFERAYVRDRVLGRYEGEPRYTIHPESGSVSFGNQWSVSHTERLGRDLIAVDLKKLYEGNTPETVRHWHAHAIKPPRDVSSLREVPNVGTRARRIVYSLADLGNALGGVASSVQGLQLSGTDFVGFDGGALDYGGWWTAEHVEPSARHIPLELNKEAFLQRCNDLHKLVVEGLAERHLRKLLLALGGSGEDLKPLGSLSLLDQVLRLAQLANRSGLQLCEDRTVLLARLAEGPEPTSIARLFALNQLRQLAGHRAGSRASSRLDSALKEFGLQSSAFSAGWGTALDEVYDGLGQTLETCSALLRKAQQGN